MHAHNILATCPLYNLRDDATVQKRIEDRFDRITLSPCQFPRGINGTANRMFRILWTGARAAGAELETATGIEGIRMTAGYLIE